MYHCKLFRSGLMAALLVWLLVNTAMASGLPWVVDAHHDSLKLDNGFDYFFESNDSLQIEQILSGDHPPWQYSNKDTVNFLYREEALWLRFDVQPRNTGDQQYLLEVASPFIDSVEFYHVRYDQYSRPYVHEVAVDGDRFRVTDRLFHSRFPIFPVTFERDKKSTFYLRIKTTSSLLAPITLWKSDAYLVSEQVGLVLHSIFYGVMLVMALYNLVISWFLRDQTYLVYVGYVLAVVGYEISLSGFGNRFIWGDSQWFVQNSLTLFVCLGFLAGGHFVMRFLSLKRENPVLYKIARLFVTFYAIASILSLAVPEAILMPILQIAGLLASFFVLYTGFIQWNKGSIWARYMVIAWSILLFGTVVFTLMVLGYLPRNPFTEYVQVVGFVVETTLLSIALAARLNQERHAKEYAMEAALGLARQVNQANQEKLILQQQANRELENKVSEQTWQLQATLDKLYKANEQLEKMAATDPLTGLYNRRFFDEFFPSEFQRCRWLKQSVAVIVMDIDHFKKINDVYGHIVGDQCLQMVAKVIQSNCQRPDDRLVRFGGEEFVIVLPNTDEDGVRNVAERVRESIEKTEFVIQGNRIPVTISVGISCVVPDANVTAHAALERADKALYSAKSAGRNCVKFA